MSQEETTLCGWCGTPLVPTWGQKSALTMGKQIYCHETDCQAEQRHQRYLEVAINHIRPGARSIAHCGAWHPLTTLPWTCPQCGVVVGQAEEGAA